LWAEDSRKASNGAAAASQVDSAAVSAAVWLVGPDIVRTTASERNDDWNMVATLIEGALQGPARQVHAIAAGNARRCLVADLMA
jgi:hypothetical protein